MSSVAVECRPKTRHPEASEPVLLRQPVKLPREASRIATTAELFDAVIKREFRRGGAFAPLPGIVRVECREQAPVEDMASCVYTLLPCQDVSMAGQALIKHFIDRRSSAPLAALRRLLAHTTHRGMQIAVHVTPAGHVVMRWQRA